ncbi:MAG: CBS domain-containing protein [Maricaulaceae bacterium]
MTAAAILKEKGGQVFSIAPDVTLFEAAQELSRRRVGALVVLDTQRALVGVVSERDIVREAGLRGGAAMEAPVSVCMTARVVTVNPEATHGEMFELMTDRRIRHLPVLDGANLVGVISIGDVVKARIQAIEAEAAALKDYVLS